MVPCFSLCQAEGQSHEVCDELYELYGSLVSQPNTDNEYCFKSYKMVHSIKCDLRPSYALSICLSERGQVYHSQGVD